MLRRLIKVRHFSKKPEKPPIDPKELPVDIPTPLWYHRLGPVTDFFAWFHRKQTNRPLTVQLCTTLVTYLAGDLLAQEIGGEQYSPERTLRMLTIGSIASIPGYRWFLWLGNNFNYSSRGLSILTKVCVQQAVFTPVFNSYFFGMQAVLTGESPSGVVERIRAAVPISMVNSLKLWPAVTAFSFAFIMPQYRFMFSGIFAVCWQAYLSFLNRSEEKVERVGHHAGRALALLNKHEERKIGEELPTNERKGEGSAIREQKGEEPSSREQKAEKGHVQYERKSEDAPSRELKMYNRPPVGEQKGGEERMLQRRDSKDHKHPEP